MSEDTQVEYCFRTISRTVDLSDDDDDDDDDDAPVGKQITRQCCEGWYTPEGKPLCSAKKQPYVVQETETKCDRCDEMDSRLAKLEKIVESGQAMRGPKLSIGYLFIRYLKEKIGSLEEANKRQEAKIMYLEEQMVNLTSSFQSQTVEVVEATPATIERAALSTADPCEAATCPDHPEAMCMVTSRCGRDIAVFVDEDFRTVNCNINEPCDLLPPSFCPDDPCLGLQCDGYPNAICVVTECDCKPSFMLPDGSTASCGNGHTFTPIPATTIAS